MSEHNGKPLESKRYPRKPGEHSQFDRKYIRWLRDSGIQHEIGDKACWFLVKLVEKEDELRYSQPVRLWNPQLQEWLGGVSERHAIELRQKMIDAGVLHYQRSSNKQIGELWVTYPHVRNEGPNAYPQVRDEVRNEASNTELEVSLSSPKSPSPKKPPNPLAADQDQPAAHNGNGASSSKVSSDDVQQVIDHYVTYHPRSRPGDKERKLIRARLKDGYVAGDLKAAIDGCHRSKFHCGENDTGRKHQSLELIVRDSKHVDDFTQIAEDTKPRPRSNAAPSDNTPFEMWRARYIKSLPPGEPIPEDNDLRTQWNRLQEANKS